MRVVVDTNVFYQDFRLKSHKVRQLLEGSRQGGYQVVVPRVVLREIANQFRGEWQKMEHQLSGVNTLLSKLTDLPSIGVPQRPERFEQELEQKLVSRGVVIAEFPNVAHEDLLQCLFDKRRPFAGKSDYQDTLIWHTVVREAMEASQAGQSVAFITQDKGFGDASLHPDLVEHLQTLHLPRDLVVLCTDLDSFFRLIEECTGEPHSFGDDPIVDEVLRARLLAQVDRLYEALDNKLLTYEQLTQTTGLADADMWLQELHLPRAAEGVRLASRRFHALEIGERDIFPGEDDRSLCLLSDVEVSCIIEFHIHRADSLLLDAGRWELEEFDRDARGVHFRAERNYSISVQFDLDRESLNCLGVYLYGPALEPFED